MYYRVRITCCMFNSTILFITKPYGWILPVFSVVVCICQGVLQAFKMRPREYELKYNDIPSFGDMQSLMTTILYALPRINGG